jgi:hypothetical protein
MVHARRRAAAAGFRFADVGAGGSAFGVMLSALLRAEARHDRPAGIAIVGGVTAVQEDAFQRSR